MTSHMGKEEITYGAKRCSDMGKRESHMDKKGDHMGKKDGLKKRNVLTVGQFHIHYIVGQFNVYYRCVQYTIDQFLYFYIHNIHTHREMFTVRLLLFK
jgi:hypothetical protein